MTIYRLYFEGRSNEDISPTGLSKGRNYRYKPAHIMPTTKDIKLLGDHLVPPQVPYQLGTLRRDLQEKNYFPEFYAPTYNGCLDIASPFYLLPKVGGCIIRNHFIVHAYIIKNKLRQFSYF